MDTSSQIAKLEERIAQLEGKLALYEHCMKIRPSDPKTGASAGLYIWCAHLALVHSQAPTQVQAAFSAAPGGAELLFLDDQGNTTIDIDNENGLPYIGLGRAEESAMDLAVEEDGSASVAFKYKGHPRVAGRRVDS